MRRLLALCATCLVGTLLLAPRAGLAVGTPDQQATQLFDADWQWRLQAEPEFATSVGDHRYDARLSDTSLAASRAATAHQRQMLAQAKQIERERLTGQNLISYDLFVYEKEQAIKAASFYPYDPSPLTSRDGIQLSLPQLVAAMPFATEQDYRNYLARIAALPKHVDGLIEQLGEAMRSGWTVPKVAIRTVPDQLKQLRETIADGALAHPFRQIPASIAPKLREQLAGSGPRALATQAAPALAKLEIFLRTRYLPAARDTIAASRLPGGADYYAFAVRQNTSTELTPAEIHALGLREVARIEEAMHNAILRAGFYGNFAEFISFINSDARFFYTAPEPLLAHYRTVVARATKGLPTLFETLPAEQIAIRAIQPLGAEDQPAAYYEAGTGEQPGALVVNTSRLDTRAKWEIETLALHEAVPGHHLQTARAHELAELPPFRRHGWYVAFGEGWALYAESLGPELGMFKDPYSQFGHLNDELFRAARLVVDTGIHALGWTRQQAIDYLGANTANPLADNEVEVDRYIGWPGQALGYKIGQLKIRALRDKAQAALGPKFDLRRFHNAVIDNGPLPLSVLKQQIDRWIASQQ